LLIVGGYYVILPESSSCDVIGSLYVLQYLIRSTCTFVLVNALLFCLGINVTCFEGFTSYRRLICVYYNSSDNTG